ncbi:MAG: SDR family oxidoreductase [Spirochaetota bacterium]
MEIKGKTVLITGAAHRMGAAAAKAFASEGADIVLHYHRSEQQARETAAQLEALGSRVLLLQADLSAEDAAAQLVERAAAAGMPPHILINSASIYPHSTWRSVKFEDLAASYRLNTYAPLALSRTFAASLNPESIIQVLDARMVDYDAQHYAYHLSKRSLHDITRMLAVELSPAIRVNGVAPGIILPDTDNDPQLLEKYKGGTLLQRIGRVEEYTQSLLFLSTNEFVTGQIIFIDGGRHLKGRFYGV